MAFERNRSGSGMVLAKLPFFVSGCFSLGLVNFGGLVMLCCLVLCDVRRGQYGVSVGVK